MKEDLEKLHISKKMNLFRFRNIVEKGNVEKLMAFFKQLKSEKIQRLSNDEYKEIMSKCKRFRNKMEKMNDIKSKISFLLDRGDEKLGLARKGRDVHNNLLVSMFWYDCFFSLYKKEDPLFAFASVSKGETLSLLAKLGRKTVENLRESLKFMSKAGEIFRNEKFNYEYATAIMNKGVDLLDLAELGIETEKNLEESLEYFDEAAKIYKREKSDLSHALAISNKSVSLSRLAELGIETVRYFEESLRCNDEVAEIFKRKKSDTEYARTLKNKSIILARLAELGIDTLKNLDKSMDCINEATKIYKREKSDLDFAVAIMNKALNLTRYAELGIEAVKNLEESVRYLDEASKIFEREKSDLDFAVALLNKGISCMRLAEQRITPVINLEDSIRHLKKASDIFRRDKSDLYFASAMVNIGNSLMRLAEEGVDKVRNLKKTLKLYDKAAEICRREKSDLKYAGIMLNKGVCLLTFAENNHEKVINLKESITCYEEAEKIFRREKSDLNFALTLMNKGVSINGLAAQGIETERNLEIAIDCYNTSEKIFYINESFIYFCQVSINHCLILWNMYNRTKEINYLDQAKQIAKKAKEATHRIIHPANEKLRDFQVVILETIIEALKTRDKDAFEYIKQKVDLLGLLPGIEKRQIRMEKKLNQIIGNIRKIDRSMSEILKNIDQSGIEISKEEKNELEKLGEDIKSANENQLKEFTNQLIILFNNSYLQKKFEKGIPGNKKSIIKESFQNIKFIVTQLTEGLSYAFVAESLLPHIKGLISQVEVLSKISPTAIFSLLLLPMLLIKRNTLK